MNGSYTAAIRLIILARHRLDCDALAALFQAHCEFRVLCTTTSVKVAPEIVRHRRPDLVILDAGLIAQQEEQNLGILIEQFHQVPFMVLDDEVNNGGLTSVLSKADVGYFTRHDPFEELADGIRSLVNGRPAYGPQASKCIQQTRHGWQLRKDASEAPLSTLTPREMEVLKLVALGHSIKHCAEVMALAPSTVDNHKARLMKKLGVHKSLDLTRLAIREGLVSI